VQTTGYLIIGKEKLFVLVRRSKYGVALKIRSSGGNGMHMADEEIYLREHHEKIKLLKQGTVLYL
jgi:hypothetical protein